uniref:ParB/Sulfiredoxin domain-containing protein n=1 Tax=Panagrolaimus sp. JU765 TaxID=591449 RepID=A0AC34QFU2_9BILA
METYFFKISSNLFELQREINKLELKSIINPTVENENQNEFLSGYHRISHILDSLGKEQKKYIIFKELNSFNNEIVEFLTVEESKWLERELVVQMTINRTAKLDYERLQDNVRKLERNFYDGVLKAQNLLTNYAKIEAKNMAIDLRFSRLMIFGKVSKYKPDYPMYQSYNKMIRDAKMAVNETSEGSYNNLYQRKQNYATIAIQESRKWKNKVEKMKRNFKVG